MAVQYKLNTGQYNKYTGKYIQGTRLLKSSAVQNLKKKSLKLNKYSSYINQIINHWNEEQKVIKWSLIKIVFKWIEISPKIDFSLSLNKEQ